ncbi:MAG: CYTH domain-containing protein [Prevotellaceae bacterium]|jgi:adenylate cyclase|nr:CYTH domain-containing protein [Prevotellaceae bacterium]
MSIEIERKFLLKSDAFKEEAHAHTHIVQGYISSIPERTVRIRIKGDSGFITIKGGSAKNGISRYEWEKKIPLEEARELLLLCDPDIVDKTRYEVRAGDSLFEIDEFHGANQGLVLAEIELSSENEVFQKPEWLGEEVTGIACYYNVVLAKNRYVRW